MKIVAITAEFNPLHLGHLRLLKKAKASQPDLLVVILNGSVMQRGDLPLFDKYTRARHALQAGADLVLELPQLFGAACAERFADAAVKILAGIDAEEKVLAFGSEETDLQVLKDTAKLLNDEPEEVGTEIRDLLDMGCSYPVARAQAFRAYAQAHELKTADLTAPNNILAIEYLRKAAEAAGDDPRANIENALLHMMRNELAEAKAMLRKATDADHSNLQAWSLTAAVTMQQIDAARDEREKTALARELEEQILPTMERQARSPGDYYVQTTRAFVLMRKGEEHRREARNAFVAANVSQPFPQVDVHMKG